MQTNPLVRAISEELYSIITGDPNLSRFFKHVPERGKRRWCLHRAVDILRAEIEAIPRLVRDATAEYPSLNGQRPSPKYPVPPRECRRIRREYEKRGGGSDAVHELHLETGLSRVWIRRIVAHQPYGNPQL